ncbi:hypothetical protein OPV22_034543 [Ensete ventricosum]|uniref:Uncharacterized protein n=1 Tax=Ensete ventricosum TaxID=4639 RepID=A0AAV8Q1A4_ENSVE|nr:hypothetical protein OPV22_034543 [Ensete ventricosum]
MEIKPETAPEVPPFLFSCLTSSIGATVVPPPTAPSVASCGAENVKPSSRRSHPPVAMRNADRQTRDTFHNEG